MSGTGAPGWRARGLAKVSGFDSALVKVEPDGKVTVFISHADAGQGHYTTFAQIAADRLGARWEDVTIVEGDTGMTPYGTGTFASRSAVTGGGAVIRACEKVARKMRRIAGEMLETDAADIRLNGGRAEVAGVPGMSLSFADVAETAYSMNNLALPEGEGPTGWRHRTSMIRRWSRWRMRSMSCKWRSIRMTVGSRSSDM